jgi:hypothetical protein
MPATRTRKAASPSTELKRLEKARDEAHSKAREAKLEVEEWDEETKAMRAEGTHHTHLYPEQYEGAEKRPKPGTDAAKLAATIRKRIESQNPHEAAYLEARDVFHRHDEAVERFKVERVQDRIAEAIADRSAAYERARDAFEALLEAADELVTVDERVRAVVVGTPGLSGQDWAHDGRPREWLGLARAGLDAQLENPGLAPWSEAKLSRYVV